MSGEPKMQEPSNVEHHYKCRIPQRTQPGRQRPPSKYKPPSVEHAKNKADASAHSPTNNVKCTARPNCSESRPKSANRAADVVVESAHVGATASKSTRPDRERLPISQKKPPIHTRTINEKFHDMALNNKSGRHIITVPLKQKSKAACHYKLPALPDQETIKRCEELELQQEDFSDAAHMYNTVNDILSDFNEEESVTSRSDHLMKLRNSWQEKIIQFDEMKNGLNDRQNAILELYASLRKTKQKLMAIGHRIEMPSTGDLRIMNVANMTPNQLLQLCAETKTRRDEKNIENQNKNAFMIDLKKFNEIPLKLVTTCEQTLATRKEMIDWFENLKNQEQGCPKSSLSKKINEFNAENIMLTNTLTTVKNEFLNELNDILRTCMNERLALQLRTEEFTIEISELNSLNADLKKQLYAAEKQKTSVNKMKIEELERELKDEKLRKIRIRDHLIRAEGQIKAEADRANLLEAALNQSRSQTRTLERTIQQQHEQNQQLQKDFSIELNKLKESMQRNTIHLEEIAEARETLQHEKEDLEKKLEELSCHYNESLDTMKEDLNKSIVKLIDVEKKYNDEIENKKKLQDTVESQCAHLLEYELRQKDILRQLQETERCSNELTNYKRDFEITKYKLDEAIAILENQKKLISEQDDKIMEIEANLKISHELEKKIKCEITKKEEYIVELENKQVLLQQQSHENECKMQVYEDQLTTLKNQLSKLQEHFIEFENLNELHDSVNRQNSKLTEMRRENDELSEEIVKKQDDLKLLLELITKNEDFIKQKQNVLHKLHEKEEEQTNVLELNQQISEKNAEIESLITNIEKRKEQISQLEKIILTIEDQNRKCAIQKRKDHDKINALEQKISEYECYIASRNNELAAPENLDNLIKKLEDELFEPSLKKINQEYDCKRTHIGNRNEHNHEDYYSQNESNYQPNTKSIPTKIVMGNFVKKTYIPNNDDKIFRNDDYLPRKQAMKNMDAQKRIAVSEAENKIAFIDNDLIFADGTLQHRRPKERLLKKLQYVVPNQVKDEKKCKMFKFASHPI